MMGYYQEYLNKRMDIESVHNERKSQLKRISELRDNGVVLSYAADMTNPDKSRFVNIDYSDCQLFQDQLQGLSGEKIDILIETPGGSGVVTEQLVRMIRAKFKHVSFIVPGWAKSAGTIFVLSGDEILMGNSSALGPIDAQIARDGKVFSAHALLDRFKKVQDNIKESGKLDPIYIPILQKMSLGEIEDADRALTFASDIVKQWLANYKFKDWAVHATNGNPVTAEERNDRAQQIAVELCDNAKWKTHSKSIMIDDLVKMRLRITNFSENPPLAEAIERYHTLLLMTFQMTTAYKIIETPNSQVVRFITPRTQQVPSKPGELPPSGPGGAQFAMIEIQCPKCLHGINLQANFDPGTPIKPGIMRFPTNNNIVCPQCSSPFDVSPIRAQLELQMGRKII